MRRMARGFTLIELIVVIVITAIIATTLTVFLKPALDSFTDMRSRADMADQADTSLRRMLRDVRRSVPNSLRVPTDQCFELVPTTAGGRYRMGPDVTNDTPVNCASGSSATCSAWIDPSQTTTIFDSLSALSPVPSVGDWVVINNQNSNDVYTGANRTAITAISTPTAAQGNHRITVSSMQVSTGYNGGRYSVVSNNEQSVFYICSGADGTVDASGNGKGTLYRLRRSFTATYPAACPATTGAAILATRVKLCSFIYDPNQGATQQSGFLWMDLEMARNNEITHMAVGAHVFNAP